MDSLGLIKKLIWLYFLLLLFEGAFRKWITPGLSSPLLIIRDPLVIAIYFLAYQKGIFPTNNPVFKKLLLLTIACCTVSLVSKNFNIKATLYGVHTNFLHFPLILVMPKVLNWKDVKYFGIAFILIGIPMSNIVVNQFEADPDDIINTTAGGGGRQLETSGGKVRASGTFTFVSGIVYYFAFVTAFVVGGFLKKKYINYLILILGTAVTLIAMVTSGSRSVVAGCIQVLGCFAFLAYYQFKAFGAIFGAIFGLTAISLIVSQMDIFQEGIKFLDMRFDEAANVEGTPIEAYFDRTLQVALAPIQYTLSAPLFGLGYGTGTNAGAAMANGFYGENEWMRNIMESGPILGNLFIAWRTWFTWLIFKATIASIKRNNYLPIFLFGAAGPLILWEQIGQPTILGFMAFGGGLCLAAMNIEKQKTA